MERVSDSPRVFASGPETADPALYAYVERRLLARHEKICDALRATADERRRARAITLEEHRRMNALTDLELAGKVSKEEGLQRFIEIEAWEEQQYAAIFGEARAEEHARLALKLAREESGFDSDAE